MNNQIKNFSKAETIALFNEKKVVEFTPEEVSNNWLRWQGIMGNFKLEGAVIEDTFVLFLKEISRGEFPKEQKRLYHFEKDRLQKKLDQMASYGLTVDDIPC